MVTTASLQARHHAILEQYAHNLDLVHQVQQCAVDELVPVLASELDLDEVGQGTATAFLQDPVTVFRFCRRARFSQPAALKLLHATLTWRLTNSLATVSTVSPLYLTRPLFFFHPALFDRFGRPCAILNLRHVARTDDGELEALKDFVRLGWEIGRKWLTDLSRKHEEKDPQLQMVVIVDLNGAGMSNLEVELLPFFMDLLKNHFPGMVGAIFVLNYGWLYSGMWQVSKRVLPNTALDRILFPTPAELLQFFKKDQLLVEHGGNVVYDYNPSNPILVKYGRSTSCVYPSPGPSRAASSESLSDMYHSASGTPHALSRRSSRLSMTNLSDRAWGKLPRRDTEESLVRRVTSFADLQERLAETQAAIESDSSGEEEEVSYYPEEGDEAEDEPGEQDEDEVEDAFSQTDGRRDSALSSRANSRSASRSTSREGSPARRNGETFSQRAVRFSGHNHVSPYNLSNPYYGYPAFVPPSDLDPTGVPRPHYHRRRKRDLVRTLTYLAVLRFLALHRNIKARLSSLTPFSSKEKERKSPRVRWQADEGRQVASQKTKSGDRRVVDIRLLYFLLLVIAIRSPRCRRLMRIVLVEVPLALMPARLKVLGAGVVTAVRAPLEGKGKKREAVMSFLGLSKDGRSRTLLARVAA